MSNRAPGSKEWWIETALIAVSGLVLAIWLWDGQLFTPSDGGPRMAETGGASQAQVTPDTERRPMTEMERLVNQGCLTAAHLRALREGRRVVVLCPPASDLPTTPRAPFP